MLDSKQHIMTDQLTSSKKQSQGKIPLSQTKASEILALQTPINEEKGRKRDRKEDTPITRPAEQLEAKRQRIDALPGEEVMEEIIESPRSERKTSPQTSPMVETSIISHGQQLGKQHSVEISSAQPQRKKSSDIKRTLIDIKA